MPAARTFPITCAVALLAAASIASAQQSAGEVPQGLREVGIDQKLNQQLPLDAIFADETGARKPLRAFLTGRPILLSFVYFECPMLCTLELNGIVRSARAIPTLDPGRDYDIWSISFDPSENHTLAAAKKAEYAARLKRPKAAAGWRFLTGDEASIRKLTNAAGFRYSFDAASKQWAHASGVMVLTPEARISRYFYGVEYSARDLRLGLVEASQGAIGSRTEAFLLYCFHYDPTTGKYSLAILRIVRIAGVATLLAICLFWFTMYRQSRRKRLAHV
jgi:protein SCO1/2